MPGMCQPVHEGGLGFDFRLGKALPNKWAKVRLYAVTIVSLLGMLDDARLDIYCKTQRKL